MKLKHPRTYHLPWTEEVHSDDKVIESLATFHDKDVIVTEKRDGENTSLYPNGTVHARSLMSCNYKWQDAIKNLWAGKCRDLPEGWRVVGENLFAQHSICYKNLKQWIEVFAIFNDQNVAISWDEMEEWCDLLGMITVPVIWRGYWNEKRIREIGGEINVDVVEGYVVRVSSEIKYEDWSTTVAKWVRKGHVQTDEHWSKHWVQNKIGE